MKKMFAVVSLLVVLSLVLVACGAWHACPHAALEPTKAPRPRSRRLRPSAVRDQAPARPRRPSHRPAGPTATATKAAAPAGATRIEWWHAMGGTNGDAVNAIADGFNKSQTKCFAQAIFQGSYDDELNKLKAGLAVGRRPGRDPALRPGHAADVRPGRDRADADIH